LNNLQFYLEYLNQEEFLSSFLSSFKKVIRFTTNRDHKIGLLRYDNIPSDVAFVFEFSEESVRIFHTLKMKFPINIYFFNSNGLLIDKYENVKTGTKKIISKDKAKFVVETLSNERI